MYSKLEPQDKETIKSFKVRTEVAHVHRQRKVRVALFYYGHMQSR